MTPLTPKIEKRLQEKALSYHNITTRYYGNTLGKKLLIEDNVREILQEALEEKEEKKLNILISEIISDYESAEEVIESGQRYLKLETGEKIGFGYPYPDTREKYIVQRILEALGEAERGEKVCKSWIEMGEGYERMYPQNPEKQEPVQEEKREEECKCRVCGDEISDKTSDVNGGTCSLCNWAEHVKEEAAPAF